MFNIGQKVIAITHLVWSDTLKESTIKKGQICLVEDIWHCPECNRQYLDVGQPLHTGTVTGCAYCDVVLPGKLNSLCISNGFVPLEETTDEQEIERTKIVYVTIPEHVTREAVELIKNDM